VNAQLPKPIEELSELASPEELERNSTLQEYKESLTGLFEHGEDIQQLNQYKNATKKLLLGLS
jgi:hypothetical protein